MAGFEPKIIKKSCGLIILHTVTVDYLFIATIKRGALQNATPHCCCCKCVPGGNFTGHFRPFDRWTKAGIAAGYGLYYIIT